MRKNFAECKYRSIIFIVQTQNKDQLLRLINESENSCGQTKNHLSYEEQNL